jgi:hypothetical protein
MAFQGGRKIEVTYHRDSSAMVMKNVVRSSPSIQTFRALLLSNCGRPWGIWRKHGNVLHTHQVSSSGEKNDQNLNKADSCEHIKSWFRSFPDVDYYCWTEGLTKCHKGRFSLFLPTFRPICSYGINPVPRFRYLFIRWWNWIVDSICVYFHFIVVLAQYSITFCSDWHWDRS